jgi:hypothetical protein
VVRRALVGQVLQAERCRMADEQAARQEGDQRREEWRDDDGDERRDQVIDWYGQARRPI